MTVEVNPVIRGSIFDPEMKAVSEAVEDTFGFAELPLLAFSELYAGKVVAALDRQHPRDLFDVKDLLANEGVDVLRQAFVVYLISNPRTISEVLAPTRKDISDEFLRGFEGMTEKPVNKTELEAVREALIADIVGKMPQAHRDFLVSFKRGEPKWNLLGIEGAADLPAVQWKQQNLDKLPKDKRAALVVRLEEVLKTK